MDFDKSVTGDSCPTLSHALFTYTHTHKPELHIHFREMTVTSDLSSPSRWMDAKKGEKKSVQPLSCLAVMMILC